MKQRLLVLFRVEGELLNLRRRLSGVEDNLTGHLHVQRRGGLALLRETKVRGAQTCVGGDDRSALAQRDFTHRIENRLVEINAHGRADRIQQLAINSRRFDLQPSLFLRQIERTGHFQFAEQLLALKETLGNRFDFGGCHVAVNDNAMIGQLTERTSRAEDLLFRVRFDRGWHQIRAECEFGAGGSFGFEHVVGGAIHFERSGRGQFAGLTVLEPIQDDAFDIELSRLSAAGLEVLHDGNRAILD